MLGELQGMGLRRRRQRLIVGNYLTTIGRSAARRTKRCLDALGMPVADGPGEGRFVVDADGAAPGQRRIDPRRRRVGRSEALRCAQSLNETRYGAAVARRRSS